MFVVEVRFGVKLDVESVMSDTKILDTKTITCSDKHLLDNIEARLTKLREGGDEPVAKELIDELVKSLIQSQEAA